MLHFSESQPILNDIMELPFIAILDKKQTEELLTLLNRFRKATILDVEVALNKQIEGLKSIA